MTWSQSYSLFGMGLVWSAMLSAVPIFTLLIVLGVMRKPAWAAGLLGLGASFGLATAGYRMPLTTALSAMAEGAAFGLFPITWIILWALALFHLTVKTGQFEIIKSSLSALTRDARVQALLIAFAFGAFVEGAAGFGAPVVIASTMLTGLGFDPFRASAICLLANTAPVAFGSIGIPIITLAGTTGLPLDKLSGAAGQLCPPVSFILPAYMLAATWGRGALSGVWLPALLTGAVFAAVQFFVSNYVGVQLTDILASLFSIAALVALLRYWRPKRADAFLSAPAAVRTANENVTSAAPPAPDSLAFAHSAGDVVRAWLPYLILVAFVLLWGWKPVQRRLELPTAHIAWPLLNGVVKRMPPIVPAPAAYPAIFNLNWLSASGTGCMLATLVAAMFAGVTPAAFARLLAGVLRQLALPTATVTSVLAMAFLMNYCGATATLGLAFAATGTLFPFFSALLGWLGVFLTGSDTSANALFGNLQVVTAGRLGLDPVLMAATNSVGGVMGKMISLQTIAVAAAATGISPPDQARLFRFTLRHSVLLAALVGCIALLLAYRHAWFGQMF